MLSITSTSVVRWWFWAWMTHNKMTAWLLPAQCHCQLFTSATQCWFQAQVTVPVPYCSANAAQWPCHQKADITVWQCGLHLTVTMISLLVPHGWFWALASVAGSTRGQPPLLQQRCPYDPVIYTLTQQQYVTHIAPSQCNYYNTLVTNRWLWSLTMITCLTTTAKATALQMLLVRQTNKCQTNISPHDQGCC